MNHQAIEQQLIEHQVRPTAVRIVVWAALAERTQPFTLKDVEGWLPYMDRSSIFRTLRLLAAQQLLHEIDDGSGVGKYCVCHCPAHRHVSHVHFLCTQCQRTECLPQVEVPHLPMPAGYRAIEAEHLVKGICPKCSRKA